MNKLPAKETRPVSLDDDLALHFGPEVTAVEIANFIDKRLAQLTAALLMIQSEQLLEADGGDPLSYGAKADALMSIIDQITQVKAAWREHQSRGGAS